ncbi:PTS ascorbate transporter subunit IIC [Saccharibacillus sp. CPCC 101409]|uniref:PTS ascorbate transporter subunit IIC n=1 Tax=Saccharibacillus sp. CPCC 101409 TaxID=3058041 RepID=UPI0026710474|nr:PTS ascorbate transporter subunit IIC [Saccharibacillus sp. CPCC 101409]MDO3410991.1 PTS ascorbate transporter subunit IIC [Saccharibacillus sp. CPCC 101409]
MHTFMSIIREPSIIIAIVTFLGLIFQRRKLTEVITGTTLSFMGFTMIKVGGGILGGVLTNFSQIFSHAFNLKGVVPSNEAIMSLTIDQLGADAAVILLFAMIVNIVLARVTKFKYIYLSLHLILFMCFAVTAVMRGLGISSLVTIIVGSVVIGSYMAVFPYLLRGASRKIIQSDEYTIAHASMTAYLIGTYLGKWFGNPAHDTENVKINDRISFLRDPNVATTLTMLILLLVSGLFAGSAFVSELADGKEYIVFILEQSAIFAAGLYIAKAGVKLFTTEIVPAFKGFSQVFAPGAVPGVDVLVLFDKSPNSALVGFLVSFFTGVACVFLFPVFGLPVIVPGIMACFLAGGAAAIFGNSTGGFRGAVLSSGFCGFLLCLLPALTLPLFSYLGAEGVTFADPDFTTLSGILWGIFRWF